MIYETEDESLESTDNAEQATREMKKKMAQEGKRLVFQFQIYGSAEGRISSLLVHKDIASVFKTPTDLSLCFLESMDGYLKTCQKAKLMEHQGGYVTPVADA